MKTSEVILLSEMTGMAGYDTSASYPAPGPQYVSGYEADPRHAGAGWAGGVQYPGHGQVPGQGSPSERYSYYDNR